MMTLLDEARRACMPIGRVGRTAALVACVLWVWWIVAACGPATGTPAEQQAAKYESDLADAIAALGAGRALDAERFAFALTLLDESRCEGHAALGASLAMQRKREEGSACLVRAKADFGGSVPLLIDLIAYASGAGAAPAARSDGDGIAKWESTLSEAFAALVSGDAVKAERLAYAATRLEEGRCEIEAVRGAALMKLSRPVEAKAAFESAVRHATGPEVGLLRVLEAVLGATVFEAARTGAAASAPTAEPSVTAKPVEAPKVAEPSVTEKPVEVPPVAEPGVTVNLVEAPSVVPQEWCDVLVAAPDPEVVSDADGRARMMATGLPWKVRDKKTGMVMLLCPPGEYMMGSPANEAGRDSDEEQQRVSITAAFYISETEVTQEQWQRTVGESPSSFKGASNPVEQVSWNDCQGFCQRTGLRLPSESEWEYACRAGTNGPYAGDLGSTGWYGDNSGGATHPVRQKRANPWGLHDMHGNVWEWCADEYRDRASGTQVAARAAEGGSRVLRGGSWGYSAFGCRSADRDDRGPGFASFGNGFRVAKSPDISSAPQRRSSQLTNRLDVWCETLVEVPDPTVVTDADGRARMIATGLAWKVRDRKTGIVMLLCPPGDFLMGSPANEVGRDSDEEQRRVSITAAFYMSEAEVTQEQWQGTMGANSSYFEGASNPVEKASWNDCQDFCQRTGLRLPSEAEWEYACRAGTTGAYAGDLDSMGWYGDNSGDTTHSVRQKRANPWGLYDMHGNAWEWCADVYPQRASGTQATATSASGSRVLRGGGWNSLASLCRSASRLGTPPGYTNAIFAGFRVARTPG